MAEPLRAIRPAAAGKVAAALAVVYVVWGSTYLAIRLGVETIPPFLMAGTRHLVAGLALLAFTRRGQTARIEPRHWRSAVILGALLLLGGNGLVTWAERRVPSGLAALIVATVPLWMTVFHAVGERSFPRGAVVAGILLGLAGLAFLLLPGRLGGERVDPVGAAVLLAAAVSWSVGSLLARRLPLPPARTAAAMEMIAGGALLWVAGLASGEASGLALSAVSWRSAAALGYLIVFGSLVGFSAYTWLLTATSATRVSTYAYVNPVVAVLLGALFAGEVVSPRILLSAAVIVAAVVLIITSGARKRREPAEAPPAGANDLESPHARLRAENRRRSP